MNRRLLPIALALAIGGCGSGPAADAPITISVIGSSAKIGDPGAAGFSPRKAATTIYLPDGVEAYAADLERLGEHSTGVGCLYLKNLEAVDLSVLESILVRSYERASAEGFGQVGA